MKKILILLLAILPLFAQANNKGNDDRYNPKYLTGAITMNNGKVSFQEEITAPGVNADELYAHMLTWAEKRFQPQKNYWSRVAYKNADKKELAVIGEEYLVFKSTALSLDRTRIYYQLRIHIEDEKCNMEMTNIRYWYEENRDRGQKITAEEWITDDMALNKKRNKLSPITGKFRSKTIDLKDEIFESAKESFGIRATISVEQKEAATAKPVQKQPARSGKLETIDTYKLPDNVNDMIAQSRITLKANGEQVEIENNNWGGMGKMLNKDVAYLIVETNRFVTNALLPNSESFSIIVYEKGNQQESIVIECNKPMLQQMSGKELKSFNSKLTEDKKYNMYICEIKSVKMR